MRSMCTADTVGSPLIKQMIESISTGSRGPEEVLERLDEYKIPWYVTDDGDLVIKYWQVVAEDFVPREQVVRVRSNHPLPPEAEALDWVSRHLSELRAQHGGEWIGVAGNQVVASATTLPALMDMLQQAGAEGAFITQIPSGPIVWRSVYGGQIV